MIIPSVKSDSVRNFGPDYTRRVMEPFTNTQLLVYTRLNAMNDDGTYRPYSCRIKGFKGTIDRMTVLGILMPDKSDGIEAVPIPWITPAESYHAKVHTLALRAELTCYLNGMLRRVSTAELQELIVLQDGIKWLKEWV